MTPIMDFIIHINTTNVPLNKPSMCGHINYAPLNTGGSVI